jgi:hypothetical protein
VRIGDAGINVWDEEWEVGLIDATSGQNTPNNSYSRTKNYIPIRPNTTYYFTDSTKTLYFRKYDINKNYLGFEQMTAGTNRNKAFSSDVAYIRFCWDGNTYSNTISVNLPNTVTEYTDYTGSIEPVTIPLGQTVYGGELDVTSGVLTVDRAIITFDGSNDENWQKSSTGNMYYLTLNNTTFPYIENHNEYNMANCYKFKGFASGRYFEFLNDGEYLLYKISSGVSIREIAIKNLSISTTEDFKTSLASNNLQVVYEITPLVIQLTPTQIKSLLGNNNLWADSGQIISGQYFAEL